MEFVVVNLRRLVLFACLLGCCQTKPVLGCRYNVREVGFVDLGIEPYYLYGYVNGQTPEDVASSFKDLSDATLTDSNIRFEMVDTSRQTDHPAMKYLDSVPAKSCPAAVLVSPDGQSLSMPVTASGRPFRETLLSALNYILSSPKRQEILQQVTGAYCVVVLVEGPDAQDNRTAKQTIGGAIQVVASQIKLMPKPIAYPPAMVTIDSKSLSDERVLLWSLGLDGQKIDRPHAAVLYGRARWVGPLFKGEEITEANLTGLLFVIGADCECGLDQRWLQGTMLPAVWSRELRDRVAIGLGFDPESPMVKMEMSSIIGRGYSSYPGVPIGYQQPGPEPQSDNQTQQTPHSQVQGSVSPAPIAGDSLSQKPAVGRADPLLQKSLYVLTALTVAVVAAGLFIVLRAAKSNP